MASRKPRIAIPVPTSIDQPYNLRSWKQYAAAVSQAGGEPVEFALGSSEQAVRELFATCDGACLPGSPADVDPARYGADRDPACGPADLPRETMDFLLLDMAAAKGAPALGICYGVQSMNVWAGGTLVQDLHALPVNHGAGGSVAIAHSVLVATGSWMARLLAQGEATVQGDFLRLPVNTSHHQAVAAPGDEFRVAARCPEDGVIEAIERHHEGAGAGEGWMLGVQWHPERSTEISPTSRALFRQLVEHAQARFGGTPVLP